MDDALSVAVQLHQAGQFAEAAAIYERILAERPDDADALHLLGLVRHRQDRLAEAIALVRRAIELAPAVTPFRDNFRFVCGSLDLASCTDAEWLAGLGLVLLSIGDTELAERWLARAEELAPHSAVVQNNRGMALGLDPAAARACFERAVALDPQLAEAHNNLGLSWFDAGDFARAATHYRAALATRPEFVPVWNNLGLALRRLGEFAEAEAAYRRALALQPAYVEARLNLGSLLHDLERSDESVAECREALRLRPNSGVAQVNLAVALKRLGRTSEALAAAEQALRLRPDDAVAHLTCGTLYQDQGRVAEALTSFRRSVELAPDDAVAHSNLLLCSQYADDVTPERLAAAHAEWNERHAARFVYRPAEGAGFWVRRPMAEAGAFGWAVNESTAPLRIGFVSGDLGQHPVGYFLLGLLRHLDPAAIHAVCYSDRRRTDVLSDRLRAAAGTWRESAAWSDETLAARIRDDEIDLLFDLAGHTAGHRLLVFARKPAPLQASWMGYVGTTGLAAMDLLLADRFHVPAGSEPHFRERVLRLPNGYVCYTPPDAPPVGPLPALARGQVTFGGFHNPSKLTSRVVRLWASILREVPGSRLRLQYHGLGDEGTQRRYREAFSAAGIAPERVSLAGKVPQSDVLRAYGEIDLALDPWPYSGGLTTCEALWMGVPVVTWPGRTFAGRHAFSHLSNVGLTETIAEDLTDYVLRAVSLARDLPRLAALRETLRTRMAASPLCDAPRFARDFTETVKSVVANKYRTS